VWSSGPEFSSREFRAEVFVSQNSISESLLPLAHGNFSCLE
jgi:hypothetical protein